MQQAICQFCEQIQQQAPSTEGELIRCFSESVALLDLETASFVVVVERGYPHGIT